MRAGRAAGDARAGVRVAVCVATFRRPEGVAALLASLGAMTFARGAPEVFVVVVDNDAGAGARSAVEEAAAGLAVPVEYLVEPERSIALARNRGVARALARGAGFVAFVDDDETVHPGWLDELLDVQARSGADAVQGAVVPRFPPGSPAWVHGAWVYAAPLPERGTPLAMASTNNVLVRAALLGPEPPFDPAFGIAGGEDSMFFMRARRAGARIVAAPAAVTEEHFGGGRARPGWVLRRAFRVGNTALHCEYALPRGLRAPAARLARATLRMGGSAALLPFALLRGRRGALNALAYVSYGVGCWSALAGYRYLEYRDAGR
jgi:glycosyltransferase involved in cell wall biosynthesis